MWEKQEQAEGKTCGMQLCEQSRCLLQVISVPAVKRFLGNVQSKDVTVEWIEGAMHEIFLGRFEAQSRLPTVHWLQQHT